MPGQLLSENMFAVDRLQLPVVRAALGSACELYPGFDDWLRNKVGDGLLDGSRRVVIYRDKTRVAGIAIAKRTVDERKLCTLWVDRTARRRKIASALASVVFQWLGTDRPLFTVPEERLVEFQGLLKDWRVRIVSEGARPLSDGEVRIHLQRRAAALHIT